MIYQLIGRPGAGKTYTAVTEWIIPEIKKGRLVVHNIRGINDCLPYWAFLLDIKMHDLEKLFHFLGPEDRIDLETGEEIHYDMESKFYEVMKANPHAFLVLDEIQNILPKKRTVTSNNEAMFYFTKHRHYGHDAVIITQDPNNYDSSLHKLIEQTYYLAKLTQMGKPSSYKLEYHIGSHRVKGEHMGVKTRTYDPQKFNLYKSHALEGVQEEYRVKSIWSNPKFIAVLALAFCFLCGTIYMLTKSNLGVLAGQVSTSPDVNSSSKVQQSPEPIKAPKKSIRSYYGYSCTGDLCQFEKVDFTKFVQSRDSLKKGVVRYEGEYYLPARRSDDPSKLF